MYIDRNESNDFDSEIFVEVLLNLANEFIDSVFVHFLVVLHCIFGAPLKLFKATRHFFCPGYLTRHQANLAAVISHPFFSAAAKEIQRMRFSRFMGEEKICQYTAGLASCGCSQLFCSVCNYWKSHATQTCSRNCTFAFTLAFQLPNFLQSPSPPPKYPAFVCACEPQNSKDTEIHKTINK